MVTDGELIVDLSEDSVREAARVPLMTGVARREWAHKKPEFYDFYRYKRLNRQEVEESVRKIIETAYITRLSSRVSNTTLSLITNATMLRYMSGVDFNFDMPEVITRLQDLEADIDFVSPCQSEVDGYVASGNNVFVYSFDYVPRSALIEEDQRYYSIFGDNSITVSRKEKAVIGYIPSAFHGLDHAFLFTQGYTSNFFLEEFTKRDKVFSRILTKMIANFVHHGNPSTENFTWPAYTNDTRHYASIDLPPRMILGPLHFPVSTFWNDEVRMLSKYTLAESISMDQAANALSQEERIQLDAYRRSWYAMWAFVVGVAILIWLALIFVAWQKIRSPMKKPYENIVVNNYGQK